MPNSPQSMVVCGKTILIQHILSRCVSCSESGCCSPNCHISASLKIWKAGAGMGEGTSKTLVPLVDKLCPPVDSFRILGSHQCLSS
jgi:hypothetical protein